MESNNSRKMATSYLTNLANEIQLKIFNCLELEDKYTFYKYLEKNNNMDYINKHFEIELTKKNTEKLIINIKRNNRHYIDFIYKFSNQNQLILKCLFVFGKEQLYISFLKKHNVSLSPTLYMYLYNHSKNKSRLKTIEYLSENKLFFKFFNCKNKIINKKK